MGAGQGKKAVLVAGEHGETEAEVQSVFNMLRFPSSAANEVVPREGRGDLRVHEYESGTKGDRAIVSWRFGDGGPEAAGPAPPAFACAVVLVVPAAASDQRRQAVRDGVLALALASAADGAPVAVVVVRGAEAGARPADEALLAALGLGGRNAHAFPVDAENGDGLEMTADWLHHVLRR